MLSKAEIKKYLLIAISLLLSHGVNSIRGLARITGEDWSYIAKILRTLDLPESIKDFLRGNKSNPGILQFFHLRKLLDIVRQGEERQQLTRFREIIEELEEKRAFFVVKKLA